MTYTPDFACKRTQKRIRRAVGFAVSCLSDKPREWSTRALDRHIGYTHKPLGKYLREKLLVECDERYLFGTAGSRCKTYRRNYTGVIELINASGVFSNAYTHKHTLVPTKEIARAYVEETFPEIQSGAFEYRERSDRLWHHLQNVRSDIRKPLLAEHGYRYEYDIDCAAPTLIFQLARQSGLTHRSRTDLIEAYIDDPTPYRQQLAQEIGCDEKTAKRIINARFAGATLRANRSIHSYLDYNWRQLGLLKQSPWFQQFSKQIKKCWDKIKLDLGVRRLSPRDKWSIYFQQERQVMGVVRRELDKTGCRYFLEHDGWRCDEWIDPYALQLLIRKRYNKTVKFSYEIWAV